MQIPYVQQIESFTDFLNLIADKAELAKYLGALDERIKYINQRLKRWEDIEDGEKYRKESQSMLAQAQETRTQANDYALAVRNKANEDSKAGMDKLKVQHQNLNDRTNDLARWEDELKVKEKELAEGEEKAAAALAEGLASMSKGVAYLQEANEIKAEYEAKLAKLRGIAA